MALPNGKIKKYLVPAITGTAVIGIAAVCILILYNLPKKAQNKQTKQKEVVKSELDKCEDLMQQFLIHKDGGMDQKKLNEFYDRCAAECPDDFTPRVRKEEAANSEKVRTRLNQRKVEKKVETGVNEKNNLHQSKDSKIVGTVKPAAVVQSNDNKPELKINPAEKNDSKSAVKKSGEKNKEEKSRVPLKEKADKKKADSSKPDITKPATNLPNEASNPDVKEFKDSAKPDAKESKEASKPDIKESKDAETPDTKESKEVLNPDAKVSKDTSNLDASEPKDTSNTDIKKTKDTSKPDDKEFNETSKLDTKGSKDATKPDAKESKDTVNPDENLSLEKSCMEELDEYFKDKIKLSGFEAAFKELREDETLAVSLVMNVLNKLDKREDKIKFLEKIKVLKSKDIEESLIDMLIAYIKKESLEPFLWCYLANTTFGNSQHMSSIIDVLTDLSSYDHPCSDSAGFWKNALVFLQSLTKTIDEKELELIASEISPYDIRGVSECLSSRNLGAQGKDLVKYSAYCIKRRAVEIGAGELEKAEYKFAQAYKEIYEAVNGENMASLLNDPPNEVHYLAVEPQVVADLIDSESRICSNRPSIFRSIRSKVIEIVNSKVLTELLARKEKFNDLPDNVNSNPTAYLNGQSLDINIFPRVLEVFTIKQLLIFFKHNFFCETKIAQADHPATLQEVTDLFVLFSQDKTNETLKKNLSSACGRYLPTLRQKIVEEIKTTLKI